MIVGILGGGMIGLGWARLLRLHGHRVRLYDIQPERRAGANTLAEACTGADLVLEALPERLQTKLDAFRAADALTPSTTLLGSSSSSILPSLMQGGLRHPERLLVLHPLHPVEQMPVVEIVPGTQTSSEAVERAKGLVTALGKIPVILRREVPGYVVNRLAAALWREAIDLVLQGVVDPETVDLAASRGPCLGWTVQGPFLTYQLAAPGGLADFMAHLAPAFGAIWQDLAQWDQVPPGGIDTLHTETRKAYGNLSRTALESERDRHIQALLHILEPTP